MLDRSTYIGSSDAAPIAGFSPWGSPLSVWMDKMGLSEPKDETLRMWLGKKLEPIINELYEQKTGVATALYPQDGPPILHPEYPFIGCHPDAEGVEFKTSSFRKEWGEDGSTVTVDNMTIPLHYFIQTQHQMAVMEWSTIDVAVLIGHDDLKRFTVPRNDEVIANLLAAEVELWGYKERGEPPPEDDPESRKAYLRSRFPSVLEDMRAATPEDLEALERWRTAKRQSAQAEAELSEAVDRLKARIGDAAGIVGEATWTETKGRKGIDMEVLREQMVAIDRTDILEAIEKRGKPFRTLRDKRKDTDK